MEKNYSNNLDIVNGDVDTLKKLVADLLDENADLKNQLELKERELNLLYTLFRRIDFSLDSDEIARTTVELIKEFFPVVRFCLIATYEKGNTISIKMQIGQEPVIADKIWVSTTIEEDTKWDEIITTEEWNRYFANIETGSRLQTSFIPFSFKGTELGFFMLGRGRNIEYEKDDWRFMYTIANYVGTTLDNSRLYNLSRIDTLTGLFNRRYFNDRLDRELKRAERTGVPVSLLMLDIDHFKRVNDTYGHPVGDQVLRQLANRLKSFAEEKEEVFRIGGEEMMLMAPGLEKEHARRRAEMLRRAVSDTPFVLRSDDDSIRQNITVSIGLACFPTDAGERSALVQRADQALYRAKEGGRNMVFTTE